MGTESFPGIKSGRGVTLTPHPLLVPWSWIDRAIPLLPLWAVRPVQSLSACTRVHFTFFFYFIKHLVFNCSLSLPNFYLFFFFTSEPIEGHSIHSRFTWQWVDVQPINTGNIIPITWRQISCSDWTDRTTDCTHERGSIKRGDFQLKWNLCSYRTLYCPTNAHKL